MAKKATKKEETMEMMPMNLKEVNDKFSDIVDKYETSVDTALEQSEDKKNEFVDSVTRYMKNMTDLSFQAMMPWVKFVCTAQISMLRFCEAQARKAEEMFTIA